MNERFPIQELATPSLIIALALGGCVSKKPEPDIEFFTQCSNTARLELPPGVESPGPVALSRPSPDSSGDPRTQCVEVTESDTHVIDKFADGSVYDLICVDEAAQPPRALLLGRFAWGSATYSVAVANPDQVRAWKKPCPTS